MEGNPSNKKKNSLAQYGFLAYYAERIFRLLQFFPPQCFLINRVDYTKDFNIQTTEEKEQITKIRTKKVDLYICIWVIFELFLISLCYFGLQKSSILSGICIFIISLRIIDIIQVNININIFDYFRLKRDNVVASLVRTLVCVILNYFELFLCFGFIYCVFYFLLNNASNWSDGYYFSAITQLTIGYGDITPTGFLKIIACFQGFLGYLFSILILSRLISMFPQIKSMDNPK